GSWSAGLRNDEAGRDRGPVGGPPCRSRGRPRSASCPCGRDPDPAGCTEPGAQRFGGNGGRWCWPPMPEARCAALWAKRFGRARGGQRAWHSIERSGAHLRAVLLDQRRRARNGTRYLSRDRGGARRSVVVYTEPGWWRDIPVHPSGGRHGSRRMIEPTVFIVDDDEAVRDSIKELARSVGLAAKTYASGQGF